VTVRDAEPSAPAGSDVLVVVGNGDLATVALGDRDLVIGRGADCDVVVDHRSLSRRHAILRPGPPATVQDLGSTNGTRVAGQIYRGGAPVGLDPGEGFHVGPIAFLIVRRPALHAPTASGADLLRVLDPTPDGVTPFVRDLARAGVNVLILGETGVGKEVLASTIHALSGRSGALTRINCAALSESLLESELFGHEKGSFTGAAAQKTGLIEAADRGTVFLDEVGELSPTIQAKLLRVVEQREVLRIGATRPTSLDVRFLAATNRDLLAEVDAGKFRRDLFFRLDGIELVIPPLRERRALIGPLARSFLDQARTHAGRPGLQLDPDAVAALDAHGWPGNVRELKAVIERAVLLARSDRIGIRHLAFARRAPEPVAAPPATPPAAPPRILDGAPDDLGDDQRSERDRMVRTLDACAGNQTRAAKQLGISRSTLVTKLTLYRIRRPRR
jgi:transcriptional regulator with GAF, ATPase, and Fis domain